VLCDRHGYLTLFDRERRPGYVAINKLTKSAKGSSTDEQCHESAVLQEQQSNLRFGRITNAGGKRSRH
jgi:hypothetical protein